MGCADNLVGLLSPLGVYSLDPGSFSLGELQAIGGEVDAAEAAIDAMEPDCCLLTAGQEALLKYEGLFRFPTAAEGLEAKRRAITALLNIGGDGFTLEAVNRAVRGCGIEAAVTETGVGRVRVAFPGRMGEPAGIDLIRLIITDILPCHLEAEFFFRYLTWAEFGSMTWAWAGAYTWDALRHLNMSG